MRSVHVFFGVLAVVATVGLVVALPMRASPAVVPAIAAGIIGLPPPAIAAGVSHAATAPVAGEEFEVTFPVLNAVTGARLTNVTSLSFAPTIAGKAVRLQEFAFVAGFRAVAGAAWMSMAIPASTNGQLVRVKLTIRAAGRQATRIESFRILAPPL